MSVVADRGVTVVLSSHLVADLERVCDHLVVLAEGSVAVSGAVDDLLASHHRLTGPRTDPAKLPRSQHVIEASHTEKQSSLLVRCDEPVLDPAWTDTPVTLDDIVLGYLRQARDGGRHPSSPLAVAR
jgi:ABC-2 type transport system ATP-binding protein